ncbi:MAG: hypothetical protein ACTHOO_01375 [Alcanivorax sp.]
MNRTPVNNEFKDRLLQAARDGDIYSYGVSGGKDLTTVMSLLHSVPSDQYIPRDTLFDLMHTLTEPVDYVNGHDPAGYIFGSGPMKFNEGQSTGSYGRFIRDIMNDNEDYVQITQTQSAQILSDQEFNNAIRGLLLTAMAEDGYNVGENPAQAYYDGLMGYRNENGDMQVGLWDAVSLGFAENAHGHVVTVTPWADNERIFVRTELPALLKNERVETINGHPREEFVQELEHYIDQGMIEEDAYTKLNRTMVMGSSYEFIRNYSQDFAEELPPHLHHDFQKTTKDGYGDWAAKAQVQASPDRVIPRIKDDYGFGNIPGVQQLGDYETEEAAL